MSWALSKMPQHGDVSLIVSWSSSSSYWIVYRNQMIRSQAMRWCLICPDVVWLWSCHRPHLALDVQIWDKTCERSSIDSKKNVRRITLWSFLSYPMQSHPNQSLEGLSSLWSYSLALIMISRRDWNSVGLEAGSRTLMHDWKLCFR